MPLREIVKHAVLAAVALALVVLVGLAVWGVPAPPSFVIEGVPRIGWSHVWRARRVVDAFGARVQFAGWYGHERRMLVAVGTTNRMHRVDGPGAPPVPVDGLPERAFDMQWNRDVERPFVTYALDDGGSELYRFFRYDIAAEPSTALTHEAARAYAAGFARDGRRLAFTSTVRNGADTTSMWWTCSSRTPAGRSIWPAAISGSQGGSGPITFWPIGTSASIEARLS